MVSQRGRTDGRDGWGLGKDSSRLVGEVQALEGSLHADRTQTLGMQRWECVTDPVVEFSYLCSLTEIGQIGRGGIVKGHVWFRGVWNNTIRGIAQASKDNKDDGGSGDDKEPDRPSRERGRATKTGRFWRGGERLQKKGEAQAMVVVNVKEIQGEWAGEGAGVDMCVRAS